MLPVRLKVYKTLNFECQTFLIIVDRRSKFLIAIAFSGERIELLFETRFEIRTRKNHDPFWKPILRKIHLHCLKSTFIEISVLNYTVAVKHSLKTDILYKRIGPFHHGDCNKMLFVVFCHYLNDNGF